MRRADGFTLIELVVVMVVISVGLLGLAGAFGSAAKSLAKNETLQQASQYAQGCAERVMAARRDSGFNAIGFPVSGSVTWSGCDSLGALDGLAGYTRTVTLCHTVTGNSTSACPNGITCGYAVVTVYPTTPAVNCPADANGSVTTTNPSLSSNITIMLVDY